VRADRVDALQIHRTGIEAGLHAHDADSCLSVAGREWRAVSARAPRQRGSSDAWMFTHPSRGIASTGAGSMSP
jgi:hypothetical protein